MEISTTAYDDAFRTLLNDCSELIIPIVNEVFGEHYTGKEHIIFGVNEHFLSQDADNVKKLLLIPALSSLVQTAYKRGTT